MKWDEKNGVTLFKQDVKTLQRAAELLATIRRLEGDSETGDCANDAVGAVRKVLEYVVPAEEDADAKA